MFQIPSKKIATNDFLYKIDIKQIDSYSFCEEQKETLVCIFWTCKLKELLEEHIFLRISQNFKDLENVSPSLTLCFGLIDNVKDVLLHHQLLMARYYIYNCRLRDKLPRLQVPIQLLMNSVEIENKLHSVITIQIFLVKKWSRFQNKLSQNVLH